LVADGVKAPPYPADTRCAGWRFYIDSARLKQSRTWKLAAPEVKPWLLMLWWCAWDGEIPSGSLPDDDELISATIGMPLAQFQVWRSQLMRGWWKADDGRLYHAFMTTLVQDRRDWKESERRRIAEWREKKRKEEQEAAALLRGVTRNTPVRTDAGGGAGGGGGVLDVGTVSENTLRLPRSARTKRRDLQGTRLAADAALPDEWKAWAIDCYPNLKPPEVGRMWVEFRNYWSDKPGKDALHLSWRQTWENNVHRRMSR
jgi:hypothetical protein